MNQQQPEESPLEAQLAAPPPVTAEKTGIGAQTKSGMAAVTDSRGMVLLILFGVTGALGIPLLWMNKNFSLIERIFWSIVVILYTTLLVGVTAAIVMWAYRAISSVYG